MKFLGISFNISELIGKMIFAVIGLISHSFANQDGDLNNTRFSTSQISFITFYKYLENQN